MTSAHTAYRTLVLAGVGSVGRAVLALGATVLDRFEEIVLMDLDAAALEAAPARKDASQRVQGGVGDLALLGGMLDRLPGPVVLVSLCPDTDSLPIRRLLASRPAAYIDAGASLHPDPREVRFSRTMPHTLQPVAQAHPHLLCQGINPGLVEYAARSLVRRADQSPRRFSVLILEEDMLEVAGDPERAVCGWSPGDLVEEVMLSPTLQIADGAPVEFAGPGALQVDLGNGVGPRPARAVGHEDIWNLGLNPAVSHAAFLYRLRDPVMALLSGSLGEAEARLALPEPATPLSGTEQVTVAVGDLRAGDVRALSWRVDHAETWRRHGLNGVQVQTASGILFALGLLLEGPLGSLPGTFTASTVPEWVLRETDTDALAARLGIAWEPAEPARLPRAGAGALRLHPADPMWA